ncbi:MotA/TolQ/ExbB proton channel family protein [Aquisphaera insulae]|uniref:MotA/TolQ/ExbB proton channel family protein n=1 Tax=Aquisphaera insulae TaxID=2712864 RepID=UPI00202E862A|nr:MotA/TolQ/ExbB proton channel family protein [Aquisphaera insulae]
MGYFAATVMLVLAVLFPIALMVFDPDLMFRRGWEQYVGTGIYFWAVFTLARELRTLWQNEQAFADAPRLLQYIGGMLQKARRQAADGENASDGPAAPSPLAAAVANDGRILHVRVRRLVGYVRETHTPSAAQLMEVNRETSGLDQEEVAGRFTLTRYILYLLPVIGFIGTVEGISKALMKISVVLPLVKDLDAFMGNLTGVTSALQVAFDSTLLALFLSAALMLVQTIVYRKSEALLGRVDGWVVEHVLPGVGTRDPFADRLDEAIGPHLDRLRNELATILAPAAQAMRAEAEKIGQSLEAPVAQLAASMERLPASMTAFQQGAASIGRVGEELTSIRELGDATRRGAASLSRIETALAQTDTSDPQLEEIRRGLDRATVAIESLSTSFAAAYEKSSRTTQEQLARTLNSLKDALELINVSMEQGNSLYRNIVKKMFDERTGGTRAA